MKPLCDALLSSANATYQLRRAAQGPLSRRVIEQAILLVSGLLQPWIDDSSRSRRALVLFSFVSALVIGGLFILIVRA